jgi:hypothetical protein
VKRSSNSSGPSEVSKVYEKSKYTYREVFDKFAKFDEEYRQRLPLKIRFGIIS